MADEHITWDKPADTPSVATDVGITWDKSPKEASIWEAMKKGFGQALTSENLQDIASQAGPTASSRMAGTIKGLTGAAKLPANILNLAGVSEPLEVVNKANQTAEDIAKAGGGDKSMLPGAMNLAGEIATGSGTLSLLSKAAAPIEAAAPYVKPTIEAVRNSPLAQSILGGAVLGGAGSESLSPMDVIKETGIGAVTGGGMHGFLTGLGHIADPVLKRVAELRAKGLSMEDIKNTSIGQMLGGVSQKAENFLEAIPFSGAKSVVEKGKNVLTNIEKANTANVDTAAEAANRGLKYASADVIAQQKAEQAAAHAALDEKLDAHHAGLETAQKEAESAFHMPMINRALEPLGITVPEGMTGTQAMKFAQDAISEGYNKVLPTIRGIRVTVTKEKELGEILNKYAANYIGDQNAAVLEKEINRLVDTTNKGGWINAEKWQGELSELSTTAHNLITSPSSSMYDKRLGKAMMELKDNWMDLIEGKKGSEAFKNLNDAFSRLQAPQRAASYVKSITEGGEFNPQQLLQSIKSGMSAKRFAGGEDELQRLATEGYQNITAARAKLKADKKANENALQEAKNREIAALDKKHTEAQRNAEAQQRENARIAAEQKSSFNDAINQAKGTESPESYAARRLGYQASGLGGAPYAAHLLGVSPLTTLGFGASTLLGSNLLYSNLGQKILKEAALAPRSEGVRKVGAALKKNAPLGALTGVQSYQQARQTGGLPEVDAEESQ